MGSTIVLAFRRHQADFAGAESHGANVYGSRVAGIGMQQAVHGREDLGHSTSQIYSPYFEEGLTAMLNYQPACMLTPEGSLLITKHCCGLRLLEGVTSVCLTQCL